MGIGGRLVCCLDGGDLGLQRLELGFERGTAGRRKRSRNCTACLREFFHVAYWLARAYARGAKPPADAAFRIEALPRLAQVVFADAARVRLVRVARSSP